MFSKGTDTMLNIKVSSQRRSMKGILLLFVEPYTAGTRDSEKYFNPSLTKVRVTVNGSPNTLYNNGIEGKDMWAEARRFFTRTSRQTPGQSPHMTLKKFYTDNKFGLLIDLRSMPDHAMHGSSMRLVNGTDGVQLELMRNTGSDFGNVSCHVLIISGSQMSIQGRQLDSVQY